MSSQLITLPYDFPKGVINTTDSQSHAKVRVVTESFPSPLPFPLSNGLAIGAFISFLYRYSGGQDESIRIIVSSPSFTGAYEKVAVNVDLSDDPSVFALVTRLIEEGKIKEEIPQNSTCQCVFIEETEDNHILSNPLIVNSEIALVMEHEQGVEYDWVSSDIRPLSLYYDKTLFKEETVLRMASHLKHFLLQTEEELNYPITTLSMMDETEFQTIMVNWNNTEEPYPNSTCVHQLFEERAQKQPNRIALVYREKSNAKMNGNGKAHIDDVSNTTDLSEQYTKLYGEEKSLTYGELNEKANILARYLRGEFKIGPDSIVGLNADQASWVMVVAILAIWKAGGAYVPLYPKHPRDFLEYVMITTKCPVIISQEITRESLPLDLGSAKALVLDKQWKEISSKYSKNEKIVSGVGPNHLGYVLFTSGSTGRPKGVLVQHGGIPNYLLNTLKHFIPLSEDDITLQIPSYAFDVSVRDIWSPLLVGAKLILKPNEVVAGLDLADYIRYYKATCLMPTPSRLVTIAQEHLPSLKIICVSGEPCPLSLVQQLAAGRTFVNLYGPTEATVDCTATFCRQNDLMVTIGKALPNYQIYVLDKYMQPVPIGVPGELYIGGVGVARGYIGPPPEVTAERFIPNPFLSYLPPPKYHTNCEHLGTGNIYKTGDLVRFRSDGNIEYIGRTDFQVKLRGLRVELGEIEVVLSQHPQVQNVLVMVREDEQHGKALVAYLTPANIDIEDVKTQISKVLPQYMIPYAFLTMDTFPLNTSGKADRRALAALPLPKQSDAQSSEDRPQNEKESKLLDIFCQVLKFKDNEIGVNDGFFSIGGDSLNAVTLAVVARKQGIHFSVKSLIELQTIRKLAAVANINTSVSHEKVNLLSKEELDHVKKNFPKNVEDAFPLSPMQKGMLFTTLYQPGSGEYHLQTCFDLQSNKGSRVDITALKSAFELLIRRHPILRTQYSWDSLQPLHIVLVPSAVNLPFTEIDWSDTKNCDTPSNYDPHALYTPEPLRQKFINLLADDRKLGFNLAVAPLIRVTVVHLPNEIVRVIFSHHHIVLDGWSLEAVLLEFLELYNGFAKGEKIAESIDEFGFVKFIEWYSSQKSEHSKNYWKNSLVGVNGPTPIAILERANEVRNQPLNQDWGASSIPITKISTDNTKKLKSLAEKLGVTLPMIVSAAWGLLLTHYSEGEDDVVFGVTSSVRPPAVEENTLGLFINTVPVRMRVSPSDTFSSLVRFLYQQQIDRKDHEHLSLSDICGQVPNLPRGQILFDSLVVFEVNPLGEVLDEKCKQIFTSKNQVRVLSAETIESSNFPLTLAVRITSELTLRIVYNQNRTQRDAIERMLKQLANILNMILVEESKKVVDIVVLPQEELTKCLVEWNNTVTPFPRDMCTHDLFSQTANKDPKHQAVIYQENGKECSLTYGELNVRGNQLANYLRKFGVGPDTLVGVCVEQSSWCMLVAILGVWKAGAAYVALDPKLPHDRLQYMLDTANSNVIVTQGHLLNRLPAQNSKTINVVEIDQQWDPISQCDKNAPKTGVTVDNLAYVLFTSGSTGTPKGVMIEHGPLANYVFTTQPALRTRPSDRVAQTIPYSFDASATDIWTPLISGSTLVLKPADIVGGPDMAEFVRNMKCNVMLNTPSVIQSMITTDIPIEMPNLHTIGVGGEACPMSLVQNLAARGIQVINMYGPTEATVTATVDILGVNSERVTIGKAVANCLLYVLDRHMRPVPIGVPGELYIGGLGVARGYIKNEEMTASRFVPNPFFDLLQLPQEIKDNHLMGKGLMYKTGDLVKYLPDGRIDYIGRADFQVKLRGLRIELGEIETVLADHPTVTGAVVIVREDQPGQKILVAYMTPSEADVNAVKNYAKSKLPQYMLPQIFVVMEAFPLNANNKADRKAIQALPPPNQQNEEVQEEAPTTSKLEPLSDKDQLLLAEIWAEVLGTTPDKFDSKSNFFELGGHSLLATLVTSRIRRSFGVSLTVRDIFDKPTLSELTSFIHTKKSAPSSSSKSKKEDKVDVNQPDESTLVALPLGEDGIVAVSFAQERLWFVDQLQGEPNGLYNIAGSYIVQGSMDTELLKACFEAVVERHSILRTTLQNRDGIPVAIVDPNPKLPFKTLSLKDICPKGKVPSNKGLEDPEVEKIVDEFVAKESFTPFDLANDCMLRVSVLTILPGRQRLVVFVIHHIVGDGWSVGLLLKEVTTLYAAACDLDVLAPLAIQYSDYATWQRSWMKGDLLESHVKFWVDKLGNGAPLPVLQLPTDRPRPSVMSHKGDTVGASMPLTAISALKALARRENLALFAVLQALFKTLLYRYTGQEDIILGTPIASRHFRGVEPLIGFFVNTLAIRSNLFGDPNFIQLVKREHEAMLEAHEHQDLPFEELVSRLKIQRDLSTTPIFQVMFVLQNNPTIQASISLDKSSKIMPYVPISERVGSVSKSNYAQSKFDLTLSMEEDINGGMLMNFNYRTDLWDRTTIQKMGDHLVRLAINIAEEPAVSISSVSLMSKSEKQKILGEWNSNATRFPHSKCLHEVFEDRAKLQPKHTAIMYKEDDIWKEMSYIEVNRRGNILGHRLRKLGVGPEVLVGLCIDQSSWCVIVGILGIWKSGGAYVALDPKLPGDRLQYMLEKAKATVIVTQSHLLERVPSNSTQVIELDTFINETEAENNELECPKSGVTPKNLCYILFTSGSTGLPKGVMLEHRCLVNFHFTMQAVGKYTTEDRMAQTIPYPFDASHADMWLPLIASGSTVVLKPSNVSAGPDIADFINETRCTCMVQTPSVLQTIAGTDLPTLKSIVSGGEALPLSLVQQMGHNRTFINVYGPTETSVITTTKILTPQDTNVTIGKGLGNYQLYILDSKLQPVPIGMTGELYVGGVSVARGYVGNEEMTASRFIKNPFTEFLPKYLHEDKGIIYKTGDVARFLPDGEVEYIGRADFQVKLRGLRIELGEIENVIAENPLVTNVVVIVREDQPGQKILVSYISPSSLDVTSLKAYASSKLPQYMVPQIFVCMAELPLSSTGKADRKALANLPPPTTMESSSAIIWEEKSDDELVVAKIWGEVLQMDPEKIGRAISFFELGGHSLLATQVVSRIKVVFKMPTFNVRGMFENPTLTTLTNYLHSKGHFAENVSSKKKTENDIIEGEIPVSSEPTVLSFAQQRLWFIDQLHPGSSTYNMPVSLVCKGPLNIERFRDSITKVVERHEILRTTISSQEGQPSPVVHELEQVEIPFEVLDMKGKSEVEKDAAVNEFWSKPFDLAKDCMIRVLLVISQQEEFIICIVMHHIASDGWSVGIMLRELGTLYEGRKASTLSIQYSDFAAWQRSYLKGEKYDNQVAFWVKHMGGSADMSVLRLPTDRPRPPVMSMKGACLAFDLSPNMTERLKALAHLDGVTVYAIMHSLFKTLLHRYSGQEEIVIGTPIANRNIKDIEPLIGFFVNTLAIRSDLSDDPKFSDLVKRIHSDMLEAHENQDLPFEEIVSKLNVRRDPGLTPIFQAMLVFQNNSTVDQGTWVKAAGLQFAQYLPLSERPNQLTGEISEQGTPGGAKFDIIMTVDQNEKNGFSIVLNYATDLFDRSTIKRMSEHFLNLTASILDNPEQKISVPCYMSKEEMRLILTEWNDNEVTFPKTTCAHELFQQKVFEHPDNIAIAYFEKGISGGQSTLTYWEMDQRSNMLANYLRGLGVAIDQIVGLCVEQSSWCMPVGEMGVWKAGAGYVALDPKLPQERLLYMLSQVQAQIIVTQKHLFKKLPPTNATIIELDSEWEDIASVFSKFENSDNPIGRSGVPCPFSDVTQNNLCYVLFTSGSTGMPKGVMVEHRSLVNFVITMEDVIKTTVEDRVAQTIPFPFDASAADMWVTLLGAGSTLVLKPAEVVAGTDLAEFLRVAECTSIVQTPSVMLTIANENLPALKTIVVGGEACPLALIQQLGEGRNFYNVYGPTETTVVTTTTRCYPSDKQVTIGKGLGNYQLYVLDKHLQPVPIGVPGELFVGGVGVARGYVKNEEMTASRFVPNPFLDYLPPVKINLNKEHLGSGKIYKTGDLARFLPDGRIDYIGRVDFQVKLRGLRIELGEIETVISEHTTVSNAVVLVREDQPGQKILVAYMTPADCDVDEVKAHATSKLPQYMVPQVFVRMDEFPLNINGKADRRALAALPPPRSGPALIVGPSNPVEATLIKFWQQALKSEAPISVDQSFFELGGTSLDSILVVSLIRRELDPTFVVMSFFQNPTVKKLAEIIAAKVPAAKKGEVLEAQELTLIKQGMLAPMSPRLRSNSVRVEHTNKNLASIHYMKPKPRSPSTLGQRSDMPQANPKSSSPRDSPPASPRGQPESPQKLPTNPRLSAVENSGRARSKSVLATPTFSPPRTSALSSGSHSPVSNSPPSSPRNRTRTSSFGSKEPEVPIPANSGSIGRNSGSIGRTRAGSIGKSGLFSADTFGRRLSSGEMEKPPLSPNPRRMSIAEEGKPDSPSGSIGYSESAMRSSTKPPIPKLSLKGIAPIITDNGGASSSTSSRRGFESFDDKQSALPPIAEDDDVKPDPSPATLAPTLVEVELDDEKDKQNDGSQHIEGASPLPEEQEEEEDEKAPVQDPVGMKPMNSFVLWFKHSIAIVFLAVFEIMGWSSGVFAMFYASNLTNFSIFYTSSIAFPIVGIALAVIHIITKWLLIGRYKPGTAIRIWSWKFIPWWVVERQSDFVSYLFIRFLCGTPLIVWYYKLLGAKIGKRVYVETYMLYNADLVHIGDDTSIEKDAVLRAYRIVDGYIILNDITIGNKCSIGPLAVVLPTSEMRDGSVLGPNSLLSENKCLPRDTKWHGSPVKFVENIIRTQQQKELFESDSRIYRSGTWYWLGVIPITVALVGWAFIIIWVSLFPIAAGFLYLNKHHNEFIAATFLPAGYVMMLTSQGLLTLITKWVVLGKQKEGNFPVFSGEFIKRWVAGRMSYSDGLLTLTKDTIFYPLWLRLWGVNLGQGVEINTLSQDHDMIELGDRTFVAQNVTLAGGIVQDMQLIVKKIKIGKNCFIGNNTIVCPGVEVEDGVTFGALSLITSGTRYPKDSTWVGSPVSMIPPTSEFDGKPTTVTLERWKRVLFDLFIVVFIPCMTVVSMVPSVLALAYMGHLNQYVQQVLLMPVSVIIFAMLLVICLAMKWAILGKVNPSQAHHIAGLYLRKVVLVNKPVELLILIYPLIRGTIYFSWIHQLWGAKIGKRVYMDTRITDCDLVTLGDDVHLEANSLLQGHTAEKMVYKYKTVKVGDRCSVGMNTVVLPGAVIENDVQLGALTLGMKGEVFGIYTEEVEGNLWEGSPAIATNTNTNYKFRSPSQINLHEAVESANNEEGTDSAAPRTLQSSRSQIGTIRVSSEDGYQSVKKKGKGKGKKRAKMDDLMKGADSSDIIEIKGDSSAVLSKERGAAIKDGDSVPPTLTIVVEAPMVKAASQ